MNSNAHAFVMQNIWLDNVKNSRQYIANSLTSSISHISLDDIRFYAACNAPIWDETAEVH